MSDEMDFATFWKECEQEYISWLLEFAFNAGLLAETTKSGALKVVKDPIFDTHIHFSAGYWYGCFNVNMMSDFEFRSFKLPRGQVVSQDVVQKLFEYTKQYFRGLEME